MIKIISLEMHNFLSHLDTKIQFEDYRGLTLIEGKSAGHYSSNGAGKSTIFEGIVYALTGNTLRGVSVNDVVNRYAKKNTRVSLTLDRDGVLWEIIRYRKSDDHGDDIVLMKDGKDISKRINKETQQDIDDMLGISFRVFSSTILLGEGLSSKFTQLSDPEKKSLIESTLNLPYDVADLRVKMKDKISKVDLSLSSSKGQLSTYESYKDYDIENSQKTLEIIKGQIDSLNKEYEDLNAEILPTTQEIQAIKDKVALLDSTLRDIQRLQRDSESTQSNIESLRNTLSHLLDCENPKCTMCHQELSDPTAKAAVQDNYNNQIATLQQRKEEIDSEVSNLPEVSVLESTKVNLLQKIGELQDSISQKSQRVADIHSEVSSLTYQISQLDSDISNATVARDNISNIEAKVSEMTTEREMYDYFQRLFSPTGIIVDILSEAISYINERLKVYSGVLLDKDYQIDFKKGKISLEDSTGSNYQSLSNGEKKRLDISIQLSLHDYVVTYCGNQVNLMFLDECLDALDDVGVDNIFEVLRLKLEYCSLDSIYVITHNDSLKDKFDSIITVTKDFDGNSRII